MWVMVGFESLPLEERIQVIFEIATMFVKYDEEITHVVAELVSTNEVTTVLLPILAKQLVALDMRDFAQTLKICTVIGF
jgi:hypothetical protein